MGRYTDQLIEIFAQCKIDELSNNEDYKKLLEQNENSRLLDAEIKRVKDIKQELEENVENQSSKKNQVIEALKCLNQWIVGKNEKEISICCKLIRKGYSMKWTESQRDHFQKYADALQNYWLYFFSFTGRNRDPEHDNDINKQHKFLIKNILGQDYYKKADKKNQNLLAEAINHCLKTSGNNVGKGGFYYLDHPGDNRDIEEKLKEECERCFVFIQLIQNIMFLQEEPGKNNYCHLEYKCACNRKTTKDFKFLLAEESLKHLIEKHNVYPPYKTWHREISTKKKEFIHLEHTANYNRRHIEDQKNKINKKLVEELDRIKWEIIEDVPD